MNGRNITPVVTVRAAGEKVFLGPGVRMILKALMQTESMKEACKRTGISYSKAWRILNTVEEQTGVMVVVRTQGGKKGGGCRLTAAGKELLGCFEEAEKRISAYADEVFREVFHTKTPDNECKPLSHALGLNRGEVITISGAGGKTTCMYTLAKEWKDAAVLLTTTTKVCVPSMTEVDFLYCEKAEEPFRSPAVKGRTMVYGQNILSSGKCTSISERALKALIPHYDFTLIEADGSRGLPLKGYRSNEPCIPPEAAFHIGIVTTKGAGQKLDEQFVLRPDLFAQMASAKLNEKITYQHIANWLAHPMGMFKGARGRRVLFINQVEDQNSLAQAEELIGALNLEFRAGLSRIIVGSLQKEAYEVK